MAWNKKGLFEWWGQKIFMFVEFLKLERERYNKGIIKRWININIMFYVIFREDKEHRKSRFNIVFVGIEKVKKYKSL